jgi:hypothetical protein
VGFLLRSWGKKMRFLIKAIAVTSHKPNPARPTWQTFVHHCLDVSRDDEMAEQAFEWCCVWRLVGFWLRTWGKKMMRFFDQSHCSNKPQTKPSTTATWRPDDPV